MTNAIIQVAHGVRLPVTRRAAHGDLPPFRLNQRDREIIKTVYEYRALTTVQIERLFFPPVKRVGGGSAEGAGKINPRCQHRLKMLYHHGFLFRDEQPQRLSDGRKPLVYFLDVVGAELVSKIMEAQIDWGPANNNVSWPFLDHLLLTNDIRINLIIAARTHGMTILNWIDDKALKSPHMKEYVEVTGRDGGTRRVAVVPDGYFVVAERKRVFHHFLEIDRGTVTAAYTKEGGRDWAHKTRAYLELYESGTYERRYHTTSLRILTVTTSDKRMAHLKAVTEATGGTSRFWFTKFAQATPEAVLTEPIWAVAGSSEHRSLIF